MSSPKPLHRQGPWQDADGTWGAMSPDPAAEQYRSIQNRGQDPKLALEPVRQRGVAVRRRRPDTAASEELLEHFRRIYLSAEPLDGQEVHSIIGVTSAVQHEGRTTVALGVAASMAADLERPVVLIEADLAHPGLHSVLGLEPLPGLAEYLRRECDLSEALRQVTPTLFVLPAGDAGIDAGRLVRQLVNADLRSRLDSTGAVLVLDLPPILASSFGVLASSMAEALIFVVRAGHTETEDVKRALERLDPALVRSVTLNGAQKGLPTWLRNLAK
jgi:Mrp family chromosome partitioning ATPase